MSIAELLIELSTTGVDIQVVNGKLKLNAPKGALNDSLLEEVRKHKEELLRLYSIQQGQFDQSPIVPAPIQPYYPLSSQQKRLYLLQQLDSESTAYNLHSVIPVPKGTDGAKLEAAFNKLLDRHEILRTAFESLADGPVQAIRPQCCAKLPVYQLSMQEFDKLHARFIRPFRLNQPPLVRASLAVCIDRPGDYLLLDMHHIIADGISQKILEEELWQLYGGMELPPVALHYKDYAAWMLLEEQQRMLRRQEDYWLSVFSTTPAGLDLPYDFTRPALKSFEGAEVSFVLTEEEMMQLRALCKQHGLTLYMYFLSVVTIVLHKLSRQTDIVIGVPTAGRKHGALARMCGMFVNTLAIRNYAAGDKICADLLSEIKKTAIEAFDHEEFPFEELVEKSGVRRDAGRNPLFDVMVNVLNHEDYGYSFPYQSTELSPHIATTAKFDLSFTCVDYKDRILITVNYCTKLFREDSINRVAGYLRQLINVLPGKIHQPLSSVELLNEVQKEQLLHEFNGAQGDYEKHMTIHELFERQAESTPHNLAIIFGRHFITYAELNRRANFLARKLMLNGCLEESFIGIMLERGIDMYIAILAVLKTGRAYIPIDPYLPQARVKDIIEDSAITKLVCNNASLLTACDVIDTVVEPGSADNVKEQCLSLAYVIYTSGSTGRPKGVVVRHAPVINLITHQMREFRITSRDRILQLSSFAFDASVEQTWLALLSGATLVAVTESALMNVNELQTILNKLSVTHLHFVPAYLEELSIKDLPYLQRIIAGGDICPPALAKNMRVKSAYNEYGPTETTVTSIEFNLQQLKDDQRVVPVGRPILNTQVYILDEQFQLSPIGVPGNMYIAGDGLAEGYLNQVELTSRSFLPNPFKKGELFYNTGDIARWNADGNIEFIGRADTQVKINGFRIELGEIEHVLLKRNEVKKCIVLPVSVEGEKHLCVYAETGGNMADELRIYLLDRLPAYMVPRYFVTITEWPLTSTGKIDRKALPLPHASGEESFAGPVNALEEQLLALWADVLREKPVSVAVNFFATGGNSLKASVLTARIQKSLSANFSLKDIFAFPTVRQQAAQLARIHQPAFRPVPAAERRQFYEMSSVQKRMYLLQQADPQSIAYNMPMVITVPGKAGSDFIQTILLQLVNRHEILRTSFHVMEGRFVQRVHKSEIVLSVNYHLPVEKAIRDFVRPFNLAASPLVRAELLYGIQETVLLLDMHHIVSDGVSQNIIRNDFYALFYNEELTPLRLQYKDYAAWWQMEDQQKLLDIQSEYWLQQFRGGPSSLQLPFDFERPGVTNHEGATAWYLFTREHTAALKRIAAESSATMYMVTLAAVNILLSRICNQQEVTVGTSISGRQHSDLENITGMFVNTLVLRNNVCGSNSFRQLLLNVKQNTIDAFEHQSYPFESLVEQVAGEREPGRNPLFDVFFALSDGASESQMHTVTNANGHVQSPAKFDLSFIGIEHPEEILLTITYSTKLFRAETINRFIAYLDMIVRYIAANPGLELGKMEVIPDAEKNHVLRVFNNTGMPCPAHKTVHGLFEEIALSAPGKIAVVCGQHYLSYSELNSRANKLATHLRNKGVKNNCIVSLFFEPSVEMVIAILGVLKAGGCYVPINTNLPQPQIDHILQDTACRFAITTKQYRDKFTSAENIVLLDEFSFTGLAEDCPNINTTADGAYVIYTSGTTGGPKGVVINHASIVNYVSWFISASGVSPGDKTALLTSYAFDLGYTAFYSALLGGAELHLLNNEQVLSPRNMLSMLLNSGVTYLKLTPSLYSVILNSTAGEKLIKRLRLVVLGGEPIGAKEVERSIGLNHNLSIMNHYGPTEATIGSVALTVNSSNVHEFCRRPVIGKPIGNAQVIVLDHNNRLAPIGTRGELCISGAGLADGYLNNPVLTAKKFKTHPYYDGALLYRSGDLARWLPNGTLEFFGRIDDQVKINGFRIELGEIEAALSRHPAIARSKVIALDEGAGKALCAYVESKLNVDASSLRAFLKQWLPEYMVPRSFVVLDSLPITANGKLDTKALPKPALANGKEYLPPQNAVEEELACIWSDLLNIPASNISVNAGFFQLGGHSLKAMLAIVEIEKRWGIAISINDIFSSDTIRAIAIKIETLLADNDQRFLSMAESLTEEELNNLLSS